MRISSKGDYGLRALFDLAQQYGKGLVQSEEIATRQGIPVNYLNQLLITMRRAGLIESLRGPQGGHMLARAPETINLFEILTALEGPLLPDEPTREDLAPTMPEDHEVVSEVWVDLRTRMERMLRETTLDDLCQRKRQRTGNVMYYI
ncbi:Rrf2 family transcriptional regulator [Candidatus Chloroploca sp. M-50]|uniref:Rrf2 family transcriptional regulator n=1 Tax=Candidatus Chloroploca mongolica TaxID=2528176 RepID=A0ABS4DEC7_9CHLR|nr:Rrf2 family transcriptional regulator [Candidatus Chloroploca mongolica]MBP1467786.1 Rrf2 family transcriptional regulator [Candidatus Chloroploca mongolica]